MTTYYGGETVKGGLYWRKAGWRMVTVDEETGVLSGGADVTYWRVPAPLMIPLALVMGGAFVLFLPLVGFLLLGEWILAAGGRVLRRAAARARTAH